VYYKVLGDYFLVNAGEGKKVFTVPPNGAAPPPPDRNQKSFDQVKEAVNVVVSLERHYSFSPLGLASDINYMTNSGMLN
jgi:hypothetical protein